MARCVLLSWWAPRRVVRGLSAMPDRVLLVVLMVAMLLAFIAQVPAFNRAALLDPSRSLEGSMAGVAMGTIFTMPLVMYAVAGLTGLLSRLTPWRLDPRHARLALFWALLATTPATLLAGMVAGLIGPSPALTLTRTIAGLGFLIIWGAGIAALARRT